MTRVAVVGGGLSGLALAHALSARAAEDAPLDVSVLERDGRTGGLIRTESVDGFLCEHGPSGFLDSVPETLALVDALGLTPRLQPSLDLARRRFVVRAGGLRALPTSPGSLVTSRILSPPGVVRLLGEPFVARGRDDDESLHGFAARRFGGEAADVLADAMASGMFGGDARVLSLRACFPAVWQMEREHGSLVRAMIARRRAAGDGTPRRGPGRLTSFTNGLAELIDGLTGALGPRVRTGTTVDRLSRGPDGPFRLTLAHGGVLEADAVVLTQGAPATARLLQPFDPSLASEIAAIPSAPMVTMCAGYDASAVGHRLDGFGFLAPRGAGLRLLGVLWESSIFPGRAPSGHVLLRVMLGGATDPGAVDLDDDRLWARVRAELRATLGVAGTPRLLRVIRHRVGIPQYVLGHADRLARLDTALARHPGLFLGGQAFRGIGINACIADAGGLADRVLAGLARRSVA